METPTLGAICWKSALSLLSAIFVQENPFASGMQIQKASYKSGTFVDSIWWGTNLGPDPTKDLDA